MGNLILNIVGLLCINVIDSNSEDVNIHKPCLALYALDQSAQLTR